MKDQPRILLAFVLSLLVIVAFSYYQQKTRPVPPAAPAGHPAPAVAPVPPAAASAPGVPAAGSEATGGETEFVPQICGETVALDNDVLHLTADSAGGKLMYGGLKHYTKPGEDYFAIFDGNFTLADYPEASTGWLVTPMSVSSAADSVEFAGSPERGLRVVKKFSVAPGSYRVRCEITLTNAGDRKLVLPGYTVVGERFRLAQEMGGGQSVSAPEIMVGTDTGVVKKALKPKAETQLFDQASWVAKLAHYRLVCLQPENPQQVFIHNDGTRMSFGCRWPELTLAAGASQTLRFSLYAGPSDYFIARPEVPAAVLGQGPFVSMGRFLFVLLNAIHRVVPNWGWVIIILTLVVKLVFHPLTRSGLRSMKKLQELRPYLKDIQTKYKDNPSQLQKEMMNLYREYKINPMGGCVPMLIQFPIFIGFFIALRNSMYLRGAPFLLWMKDLSEPDRFATISGFSLNLLPVVMAATSFWQQKLTPQDPSQKMMAYIMPFMFLFLFYNFSSGLLLYWVTMNIASVAEQYSINRMTSLEK